MTDPIIVTDGMLSEAPENAVIQFVTKAFETQDAFIFETIRPFCEDRTNMSITKDELIRALTLLREQEPVEPHVEHDSDDDSWYYGCGACHEAIDHKDRFCRHCGRKVKWDD